MGSAPTLDRLVDRAFALRDATLSNPRFQRWAARFPMTRGVASRRATALFDICAGFVYSQILQACVRLRVLELLAERPRSARELADAVDLPVDAAERLLEAAASLKLAQRRSRGRYGLGVHGASYLGNPAVGKMVEHHALLYRDLQDPIALLRGQDKETDLMRFWSYAHPAGPGDCAEAVAPYSELMASSLSLIAEDILEAYPVDRHRRLLDVGGGTGAFIAAVARHAPALALSLFDLPPVAAQARDHLKRSGLSERVRVTGGDVFRDALPQDVDLVTLVRILHDHDDAQALRILRAVRTALRPGGTLLIAEPMSGTSGAEPVGDAYFGFYLLAMGQGRPRSPGQLRTLLSEAGFFRVEARRTRRPMLSRLLVAQAP
ncbi:MAG: methyltransferase [Myxococcota bacterium]